MASRTEEFITVIRLNTDEAKKELEELKKKKDELMASKKKAILSNDHKEYERINKAIKKIDIEMKNLRTNAMDVDKVLASLSTSSLKELRSAAKHLNAEIAKTPRGTAYYQEQVEKLKQVKKEIKGITEEQRVSQSFLSRAANFFNRNWGVFTQAIATFSGLTFTVRKSVSEFAAMDQEMQNVRKYTGQTREEVEMMNERFKAVDTRTPREQLNQLAGAAGRLGITATSEIMEFVDAADKINVALGDDLGEGAVDQIGKLAMAFGEEKKKGLRGAMLATGSAINELAQNSAANAGYLVDFTARLAGLGKQAGMAQTDIMGFGAVLDSNMQQVETSATAMSQLITKMVKEPGKFARIAGEDVQKFTNLVKTDINEALVILFQDLNKRGGLNQLAPMLDDMELSGSRAVQVLSSVASHIGEVKDMQQLANDAYIQGKSVVEEFDVQNNTVQADIDKASKAFKDMSISLGKQLLPIARYAITTGSMAVRILSQIITFTTRNWKVLTVLASAVTAYVIAMNKKRIVDGLDTAQQSISAALHAAKTAAMKAEGLIVDLLTGKITLATAAQQVWNKVILANPYVATAAAVAGLTTAIIAYTSKADEATELEKKLADANQEAAANARQEITEVSTLIDVAKNKALSDATRKEAIAKLSEKYPEYLNNLTLENIYSQDTKKSVDALTGSILARAQAQAYLTKIEEIERKKLDVGEKGFFERALLPIKDFFGTAVNDIIDKGERLYNGIRHWVGGGKWKSGWNDTTWIQKNGYAINTAQEEFNRQHSKTLALQREENFWQKKYLETEKKIIEEQARLNKVKEEAAPAGNNDGPTSGYISDSEQAKAEKESKRKEKEALVAKHKAEAEQRKVLALAKKQVKEASDAQKAITDTEMVQNFQKYSQGLIDYRTFKKEEERINEKGLNEQMKIYAADADRYASLLKEKEELKAKYLEDVKKMDLKDIDMEGDATARNLRQQFMQPDSSIYNDQMALEEALFQNEINILTKKRDLYQKYSEEWLNYDTEIEEQEGEHKVAMAEKYEELLMQYREQFGKLDVAQQEKIALKGLDDLLKRKLIKEKEYQEMLKNMKLYYAKQESEEELRTSAGEKFKANSHSAYETASNKAKASWENKRPEGPGVLDYLGFDVAVFSDTLENIRTMEEQGVISHQEAMAAMGEATSSMCDGLAEKMQRAFDTISPIMNAMSSYYSAQSDYEVMVTEKKYDKLIDAAGSNSAKAKKLEEKKQKELAKIKTKYARKEAKMQVAQAIAQTAISALAAYTSVMKAVPFPANTVLAPVTAGIALAAGAIQIATIKKQQQAQEAGYYSGGFTGGNRYRREAGVVHEGEFVANHEAVNNTRILPALQLIDQAQRNNTIGRLTAQDVSRSLGQNNATVVSAPVVNVQATSEEMVAMLTEARNTIERLGALLEDGIHANVSIDGPNGIDHQYRRFNKLKGNK